MIKEAIGFGATVEEAKEKAIEDLNASDFEDIQFEVVSMPKKKVLGIFGGCQAQVRAFVEIPEKNKKPAKVKKANEKAQPKKSEKAVKVVTAEKAAQPKPVPVYSEAVDAQSIDADSPAGKAVAYIKTIISSLNCGEVSIKVASRENGSLILLDGDDLNVIIGRRGETLDAIQYLASLAANNGGGHYKISLNIGNYREKREETLTKLAKRMADQALKSGKCRTLEPMNPYERRIIHTAVQQIEGVASSSFGEGAERRVVIAPEGVEMRPMRRNGGKGRGGNNRRNTVSKVSSQAPAREPKKDTDIPLYGKIN